MSEAYTINKSSDDTSELREEVELYQKILDAIADMVLCKGPRSRIVWANKAFREYYGMSNQQLRDMIDAPFNEPDFTQQYIKDDHFVFTTGRTLQIEEPVTKYDGTVRPFHTVKSAVFDRNNRIRMTVGVSRDITEQKRVREELELYRKQLEDLVHQRTQELSRMSESLRVTLHGISDGVLSVDATGTIRVANQSAVTMLAIPHDSAVGHSFDTVCRLFDEENRNPITLWGGHTKGELQTARLARADGSELLIEFKVAPLLWDDGTPPGQVVVLRDITLSRQLEEKMLQQQKLDSLSVLAGGIAHDFNNFLQAILGNISLAQLYAAEDPRLSEVLERAEKACARAQSVTGQLLAFSRGGSPHRRPMTIMPVVEESATLAARGSNIRVVFNLPSDLWPVSADEGQLGQVISNLVINAEQAMPEGGTIEISGTNVDNPVLFGFPMENRRCVLISIRDTGCGIAHENLSKIFDPYFTTKSKGSGLGLASVHAIVRNHDGHIVARSDFGKGTEMLILLPSCDELTSFMAPLSASLRKGNGERILIMDDDELIRQSLLSMLSNLNYRATCCASASETLQSFRGGIESGDPFNCVILDLTIPGGRGGEAVIVELIKIDPKIRSIASSGYSAKTTWESLRAIGFTAVLPKPYTLAQLSETLVEVIQTVR